jgi:hypothetical protein
LVHWLGFSTVELRAASSAYRSAALMAEGVVPKKVAQKAVYSASWMVEHSADQTACKTDLWKGQPTAVRMVAMSAAKME